MYQIRAYSIKKSLSVSQFMYQIRAYSIKKSLSVSVR
jgi:hypothetical protein